MAKTIKQIGLNVLGIDTFGITTPLDGKIYKDENAVAKALEKGTLSVTGNFAGFTILPVFAFVEAAGNNKAGGEKATATALPPADPPE